MTRVVIYTKENCSYCNRAKMIMANKGIKYTELKLNEDFTSQNLKEIFPTATTYPVIVVNGFNIGGCNELEMVLNEEIEKGQKFLTEG
jgi:glutaredoxin